MRRLILFLVLAAALAGAGCKRRDRIRLEPTQETMALESKLNMADPKIAPQLVHGFHPVEQNSWRWTTASFSVVLKPPAGSEKNGATLAMDLSIPQPIIQKLKETRLTASLNGSQVGWAIYNTAGEFRFTADIPAAALGDEAARIDFALDRFLGAGVVDSRELGVIVSSIGLEAK